MKKRRWLITGASSGLGKALVQEVIQKEELVIASFRNKKQADAFELAHKAQGHKAIVLDLGQPEQIAEKLSTQLGDLPIDLLVNNAGIGFIGAVEETSLEEIRQVMEVNFYGPMALTNALLPAMRKRGSGRIIQISSHAGIKAFAGFGVYNASKFALEGLAEAQAQELAELGIQMTLVEPGPFRTEFAGGSLHQAAKRYPDYNTTAGIFRERLSGVDGKQEGDPQKAASALFALSQEENPGLRMPLGRIPLQTIQLKIDQLQADLDRYRERAAGAVFDAN